MGPGTIIFLKWSYGVPKNGLINGVFSPRTKWSGPLITGFLGPTLQSLEPRNDCTSGSKQSTFTVESEGKPSTNLKETNTCSIAKNHNCICLLSATLFVQHGAFGTRFLFGSSWGFLHHPKDPLKRPAAIVSLVMDSPASSPPVHVGAISNDWRLAAGGCDRDVRKFEGLTKTREMDGIFGQKKSFFVIWEGLKGYSTWNWCRGRSYGLWLNYKNSSLWMVAIYDNVWLMSNYLILTDKFAGELGMPMLGTA